MTKCAERALELAGEGNYIGKLFINGQLGEYIRDVKVAELAASGEFTGFSIRH